MIFLFLVTYWGIGHVLHDIEIFNSNKVSYDSIRSDYVTSNIDNTRDALESRIRNIEGQIQRVRSKENILRESSSGFQNTINQIINLQKRNLGNAEETNKSLNQEVNRAFDVSLQEFFERQNKIQGYTEKRIDLLESKNRLEQNLSRLNSQIASQESQARTKYNKLREQQEDKEAIVKFFFLAPFLLFFFVVSNTSWKQNYSFNNKFKNVLDKFFVSKKLGSIKVFMSKNMFFVYIVITLAFFAHMVKHLMQYAPHEFTKYSISVVLIIVLGFLIAIVFENMQKKKARVETKERMQFVKSNYLKNLCPSCGYPLKDDIHVENLCDIFCSNCGAHTHEKCSKCGNQRKSFMTYCDYCGNTK